MFTSKLSGRQTIWHGVIKFYIQKLHFKIYSEFFSELNYVFLLGNYVVFKKDIWLERPCTVRGANNHNTIYCYYIPFKNNLGIVFPKFEVSSINDGSHWGKWSLANPYIIAKFQSKKSLILTPDLGRSWKSTIWKYFYFSKIPSGSASKMHLKV